MQLPKHHWGVTNHAGVRESLRFQEEMGPNGECKVVGLLLRDRLQSHSTAQRLLSMSNKALVNTTLLADNGT